ncbi:kinase-like protein [Auricularia subglabra TFB-10046 SS5]|uniref:Kinase-like protein n=1 Tax=Auricularia subglabra (strain TFB-10046 / SS5) TaxID=717982 RepID=J0WRP4_AURST|nr:kinase-like protein [Auricularia subglabra TFB-10046 SS5]
MESREPSSIAVDEAFSLLDGLANCEVAALRVDGMLQAVDGVSAALSLISSNFPILQKLTLTFASAVAAGRRTADIRVAALLLLAADCLAELLRYYPPILARSPCSALPAGPVGAAPASASADAVATAVAILEEVHAAISEHTSHNILAEEKQRIAFRELAPRLSQLKSELGVDTRATLVRCLTEIIAPSVRICTLRFSYAGHLATVDVSSARIGHGAGGTVHHGSMTWGSTTERVAVKVVGVPQAHRDPSVRPSQVPQALQRELTAWCRLSHEHVLPLYGASGFGMGEYALVSPYTENGDMGQYLKRHPGTDKLLLLTQVAEGLQYLHDVAGIVHGDLKCENVLISSTGSALLSDFGLSTTAAAAELTTTTGLRGRNTLRFSARELITDEAFTPGHPERKRSKTTMSDVYAFGMVVYQVYSGEVPWARENDMQVVIAVEQGLHPPRLSPEQLGEDVWVFCARCWNVDAEARPSLSDALRWLGRAASEVPSGRL